MITLVERLLLFIENTLIIHYNKLKKDQDYHAHTFLEQLLQEAQETFRELELIKIQIKSAGAFILQQYALGEAWIELLNAENNVQLNIALEEQAKMSRYHEEKVLALKAEAEKYISYQGVTVPNERYGTKICIVLETIQRIITEDAESKILIFSNYSDVLDCISKLLTDYSISYRSGKGTGNSGHGIVAKQVNQFKTNQEIKVFLLNVKPTKQTNLSQNDNQQA